MIKWDREEFNCPGRIRTWTMDARSSLHQFLRLHENFLFRPQPNVPVSLQPTFTLLAEEEPLLAEERPNLYKNVRRHCQDGADGDELASLIIRRLVRTTHWVADKRNVIEQQRQQRRAPTEGTEVTSVVLVVMYVYIYISDHLPKVLMGIWEY